MRRVLPALVVVGLALAVWLLWPRGDDDPATTTALASGISTTSTPSTTATSAPPASTTLPDGSHVVKTAEEAEEILRELWFGWFEGIYNQDEERIRQVVASQQMLEAAIGAFGVEFISPPTEETINLTIAVLHSDEECLVTWGELDVSEFRGPEAVASSVQVLRFDGHSWRFLTSWASPDDLWEPDCEAELQPF